MDFVAVRVSVLIILSAALFSSGASASFTQEFAYVPEFQETFQQYLSVNSAPIYFTDPGEVITAEEFISIEPLEAADYTAYVDEEYVSEVVKLMSEVSSPEGPCVFDG